MALQELQRIWDLEHPKVEVEEEGTLGGGSMNEEESNADDEGSMG